jgi:uncharacterized membrane protein/YHS domain-containing protein
MCPVMTDEKADASLTVEYQGRTVAFCCDRCVAKFQANPAKYLHRLPQFGSAGPGEPSTAEGGATPDQAGGSPGAEDNAPAAPTVSEPQPTAGDSGDAPSDTLNSDAGEEIAREATDESARKPWLGRVHPLIVHFPLAGFPLALLALLVALKTKSAAFDKADVVPLIVGTVAAILAVITGNIMEEASRFSASMNQIAERHEFVSEWAMILGIVLCLFRIWRWNRLEGAWRVSYGVALLVICGLLAFTGYLGGSLVFGPDHWRW